MPKPTAKTDVAKAVRDDKQHRIRKNALIRALAEFLSNDVVLKSVALQAGKSWAKEWAKIRNLRTTPTAGYATVEETVAALEEDLA